MVNNSPWLTAPHGMAYKRTLLGVAMFYADESLKLEMMTLGGKME